MKNEMYSIIDRTPDHQNLSLTSKKAKVPMISAFPEILFITSYPPRECGIATYSQDLVQSLCKTFKNSFSVSVCALEVGTSNSVYPEAVKYKLDTQDSDQYTVLSRTINSDSNIKVVVIQHEFGLFDHSGKNDFLRFMQALTKPILLVFHTVLPHPDEAFKHNVQLLSDACMSLVVMTQNAAKILVDDYGVSLSKINVIAHGTHLVPFRNKEILKVKFGLQGRKVLSTFGLLSSGKSIETSLEALPAVVEQNPEVVFLIIGKSHPGVVVSEGEKYRIMLQDKVKALHLERHVLFINQYLPLSELLEYLQMTDIYLFTSKDPNQAVSGTFSYAMSCACPIISTPIPHALEVLQADTGILIDFQDAAQLSIEVNRLMGNEALRKSLSSNALHRIVPSAWQNSAIAHGLLLQEITNRTTFASKAVSENQMVPNLTLQFRNPPILMDHIQKMTTDIGIIQFSKINQPDISSGYTLDDNARALITYCMHYDANNSVEDLNYLNLYLDFIRLCQQPNGYFLNYVDHERNFTPQNDITNLADSNGRAIWALGFLISKQASLPAALIEKATDILDKALQRVPSIHSTRAMAFVIKGLYYANSTYNSARYSELIVLLADRLIQMHRHESDESWVWYESYLTYANSILPEAMLLAWLDTGNSDYKKTAKASFDFLLSLIFDQKSIKVISNQTWLHKGKSSARYGEQPIDVAYTIMALNKFYTVFQDENYLQKMTLAFEWFLGNNHLHQIMYNPSTGGCYDGLEEHHVNLNQGAESTLSYLMARLTIANPFEN